MKCVINSNINNNINIIITTHSLRSPVRSNLVLSKIQQQTGMKRDLNRPFGHWTTWATEQLPELWLMRYNIFWRKWVTPNPYFPRTLVCHSWKPLIVMMLTSFFVLMIPLIFIFWQIPQSSAINLRRSVAYQWVCVCACASVCAVNDDGELTLLYRC